MPVVVRTPCGPIKGVCQVAEQSFGMFTIRINTIVFKLSSLVKEERKKINKIEVFASRFLECDKG